MSNDKIDDFRDAIEYLADNNLDEIFLNRGDLHASIVLENIIKISRRNLYIYSGSLNSKVFDTPFCLSMLEEKINDDNLSIKVLIDDYDKPERSQAYELLEPFIKPAPKEFLSSLKLKSTNQNFHFAVSDRKSYRIETDKDKFKATGNFNDPKVGRYLSTLLSYYFWKSSK